MSKRQKRNDLVTLAEWAEDMSRHHLELAQDVTRNKQNVRSLRFRAKRLAQIATVLRQQIPPKPKHMVMVCGSDCHPGGAVCNNYCNLAPQKGPMADFAPRGPDHPDYRPAPQHSGDANG